jgi:6-phosphogluconolactonase/glucosamine-6-phosphate isomerase/deaminase
MNQEFTFEPASWIPFRDKEVLNRMRSMRREDMEKHPNPDFRIKILLNPGAMMVADMVMRMKLSDDMDQPCVMVIPNPAPDAYQQVAELVNRFNINCRNVHIFALDEWADDQGNIAPLTYKAGFGYSFRKYLIGNIDEDLRMPEKNVHSLSNENIAHYSDLIAEAGNGGADITYTGPGWAGHLGFIDPGTPEFACESLEEFLTMGARVVTLHPLTIAQNSLHGCFGQSGDIASVPPKAATIGPLDIKRARNRFEIHALTTSGAFSSWQRMISRLVLYGPVTPLVPTSIVQLWPAAVYVSEAIAAPFDCDETAGY